MEPDNQKQSEGAEETGETSNNQNVMNSEDNLMELDKASEEPTTSSTATASNIQDEPPEKKFAKRNYRRRTVGDTSDSSDSDDPIDRIAGLPPHQEGANLEVEDSNDGLNLEHPASDSDNATTQTSNPDSTTDSSDSSLSFGSSLSPLLRIGLGNRRRTSDDSDTDSDEDEEIIDKSKKQTTEIMNKEQPNHNSLTWPRLLKMRESGFYCNLKDVHFKNHRKVFERNFYGSLNAVERLELMSKLDEHHGCVNCLGFSKNGLYLLSGSDDLHIILWNWYNNKPIKNARTKHGKNIFQTKFYDESPTVMKAISAAADGTVSTHSFTNDGGHHEKQVYAHTGACHKLAVTDNVIYTCGEDGIIMEYDTRTKLVHKMITVREKHKKIPLFSISAHPSEMKYAVSGRDQFVRVYDRRNPKTIHSRHCPGDLVDRTTSVRYISCCVYNYNGAELLASFNDENIYLFDAKDTSIGSYLHRYQGHVNSSTIKGVNFYGPESEYIVSGSDCSNIFLWHKENESIVQWMRGDENGIVNVLEPHPFLPVLATSGLDKDIKIWMPSNDEFKLNTEDLEKCVYENVKTQYETGSSAAFALDPAIIQLARYFFQRRRERSSPDRFGLHIDSNDSDSP